MLIRLLILMVITAPLSVAQTKSILPAARHAIDAGNQAWIDGMKSGDVARIADTYAADALDCGPTGECSRGRAAIVQHFKERFATTGRATAASVTSTGSVQQGDFVYEWGHAEASFGDGEKLGGRYLTVWRRESAGQWKIFRNMSIPADQPR
jgi:ketosteroid isomerase-like protein